MGGGNKHKQSREQRKLSAKKELAEIEQITARLQERMDASEVTSFSDFPLSARTKRGLQQAGFVTPTDIQKDALARGLEGRDVLGAAKTGSGKTLAFLIPVVEKLWRLRWSKIDGVGALIISPTRELALQTYQCLTKIANQHELSAALIIGGTTFEKEQAGVRTSNIVICTPGRLLQHMDETYNFECDNLQMLVLDEADRILDLGFEKAMNAIIQNLPTSRQTLLFSATQTKSVRDLARLSLKDPEFISVHAEDMSATPASLTQAYVVVELPRKIDVLYSFIKTHLTTKTLVFVSSCKQVRFLYEAFRRFRPGVPLMELHGRQKQAKRIGIFKDFSKKTAAVLFATDIAARGLDIPKVDWVVQLDCPEDVETYVHRVGRTARYNSAGKAMLILVPSEEKMVTALAERRVNLVKSELNDAKLQKTAGRLQGLCAEEPDLKYLAQKSYISYMRSILLQKNKEIFDVHALPAEEFALALGLPNAPKIKVIQKDRARLAGKAAKAAAKEAEEGGKAASEDEDERDEEEEEEEVVEEEEDIERGEESEAAADTMQNKDEEDDSDDSDFEKRPRADPADGGRKLKPARENMKFDRLRRKKNQALHAQESDDDDEDFLTKAANPRHEQSDFYKEPEVRVFSKRKLPKTVAAARKAELGRRQHVVFEDDGAAVEVTGLVGVDMQDKKQAAKVLAEKVHDVEEAEDQLRQADFDDKIRERARIRERKQKRKQAARAARLQGLEDEEEGGYEVRLGGGESDGGESEGDGGGFGDSMREDDSAGERDADEEEEEAAVVKGSRKLKGARLKSAKGTKRRGGEGAAGTDELSKRSRRTLEQDEELAATLLGL